ncbi:hypothetical protein OHB05_39250 [Streptomyces sp. NBC_00638]|uniref:hypothetical protein n=1 Tax=unclassified Streptomyces TaxID=2593676 RepID=UPI002255EA3E|nr:hypothetical protein [Streptomyces sp. NBC_00638]MCX5008587.1 hypothetical protein [Streptomyces sp. NBC_00638]
MYGNITVLGVVAAVDDAQTLSGRAALLVGITATSTFVAHVFADLVGQRIESVDPPERRALREKLRDAWPIATSGVPPTLMLALGAWGVLSAMVAQLLATAVVLARLASVGWVVEWLSGRPASFAAWWGGFGLAVIGVVIAALKVFLSH